MIKHITRYASIEVDEQGPYRGEIVTEPAADRFSYQLADCHEVTSIIPTSWPGMGRCDSCGRVIVRGMGRWWERGEWR